MGNSRWFHAGTLILGLIIAAALFAPLLAPYDPAQQNLDQDLLGAASVGQSRHHGLRDRRPGPAGRHVAERLEGMVVRQHEVRALAHVEPALDVHALLHEPVDLVEERVGVEHDAHDTPDTPTVDTDARSEQLAKGNLFRHELAPRARRSLTWASSGSSPISSRKSVPLPAISNLPLVSQTASVKAPLTWPKSSLSSRLSGMPPQLTGTNGLQARRLQEIALDSDVEKLRLGALLRLADGNFFRGDDAADAARGIVEVAGDDRLRRADDHAGGFDAVLDAMRAEIALRRGHGVRIDVERVVGAGLHAALAADAAAVVEIDDAVRAIVQGDGGADLDAGSILAMIAAQNAEVAARVGELALLDVLDYGARCPPSRGQR